LSESNDNEPKWGGSKKGKAPNRDRDFSWAFGSPGAINDININRTIVHWQPILRSTINCTLATHSLFYNKLYMVNPGAILW
jgi:hypothetical protein